MRVLGACSDDFADVLATVFTPVPHKKRMRSVIGVAAPVHLDVAGVISELALVFVAQIKGVARFRQQAIEKFDITWVLIVIEFVIARMMDDQHAALFQQRLVPIKVEVIAKDNYL